MTELLTMIAEQIDDRVLDHLLTFSDANELDYLTGAPVGIVAVVR